MKRQGDTVQTTSKILPRITGSDVTEFNWKIRCFCCGSPCVPDPNILNAKKIGNVYTLLFKKTCNQNLCTENL